MTTLTLAQAEDLHARTHAAIPVVDGTPPDRGWGTRFEADRERLDSDLDGLRDVYALYEEHARGKDSVRHDRHARRYSDGLVRTARLYGVEVRDV